MRDATKPDTHQHPMILEALMKSRLGRHRVNLLGLLVVLGVVSVLLAHEGHTPLPSKGAEVDVARGFLRLSPEARAALDVQTTELGDVPPHETLLAYVTLAVPWKQHAFAVSRLPGRIVQLLTRPGDRVSAQQVMAQVQSQELESFQLEIQAARTEAKLAEQVFTKLKESTGSVPERDLLAAEVQLQQSRTTLDLAKMKWRALGLPSETLEALLAGNAKATPLLPILAPVGGTVIHADLSVGKVVEPGEHLFEVMDLSTIWARVGVLEKDLSRVVVGQPVEVRLTAYPGEVFRGTVTIVGQYLDPTTHLNDVWVEFPNPIGAEPRLLPGMTGEARIELPTATGTKAIPRTALIHDGVDRFLFVEEANAKGVSEYRKKSVVVVRETPDTVEIRAPDLFPGDRVVTQGGHELGTFFTPGVLRLTEESIRTIGLQLEPVSRQAVETVVEVSGAVYLPPDRRSIATARLPGEIVAIKIDRGQSVRAGDVLAEVFSLDLLNLQLDLLREHQTAELAQQQFTRLKESRAAVPTRRLVEAEAAVTTATNKRESIRRRLELVGLSASQLDGILKRRDVVSVLPVRATVAGTVVAFDRVIGQTVRVDEPLFEVHDLTRPWIEAFVSEQDHARVRVGQAARVRLVSSPEGIFNARVSRSGRTFGESRRTLSVWLELHGELPRIPWRHNQMARLSLVLETHAPTLAVPLGAIVREGIQSFVFVQIRDTFERREVILGRSDDRFAEIKSGLVVGETIATTAAEELNTAWQSVR